MHGPAQVLCRNAAVKIYAVLVAICSIQHPDRSIRTRSQEIDSLKPWRVNTHDKLASLIMNESRSAGYDGSVERMLPPALRMPSNPTSISIDSSKKMPTRTSGPTPSFRREHPA